MVSAESKPLVLISGTTGHIGFRTLLTLVESGRYRARVTIRRESQIEDLKNNAALSPYLSSVESFKVVPDITAPGAYDNAAQGVDFVLHIASPIPDLTIPEAEIKVQEEFIDPAVNGTKSILESAAKSPSVKRVVITSSVVVLNLELKNGKTAVGPYDLAALPDPKDPSLQNHWTAYRASKILSHDAATKFMDREKPSFDLVRIMPAYTQGRKDLAKKSSKIGEGSNAELIELVQGKHNDTPRPGCLVHVNDVAALHVMALDLDKAKNGDNFIAGGPGGKLIQYDDVNPLVEKLFPAAVKSGITPLGGHQATTGVDFDITNAVEKLDYKPASLEQMVESLVGQYIELVESERNSA